MDWVHLTKNCVQCLALVNTVVNKIMVFWVLCSAVRWTVHVRPSVFLHEITRLPVDGFS
jgi:hypothetical protein